ncbi:reprolysin-like metallopeptidase [Hymenobacter negativus]|uniref:T9SS type A sorting domain-containing protein n=1 Tax=Hymenobacter negativus TaxID=2795026 RepID=A0ABS3QB69_9BACT|nr:zinc-dependent metalloprotease family protein [Hymenobacter negativus]MBO2008510.1 T9SS type A sorting domain-containing protein [Hymenobacter negativus]
MLSALERARPLALDVAAARLALAAAPPEGRATAAPLVLALPLPNGGTGRFAVWQTAVMAPALATRYPEIQTYAGRGLDDATATVRLDITPAGFHAQVLSAAVGTVYIEPGQRGDARHYLSFFSRDARPEARPGMVCQQPPVKAKELATGAARVVQPGGGGPAAIGSGGLLRTYRLAVAATGEYTQFHGGTVPQAMAAIVTSVNRINGLFETEVAVRFVLIANNSALIYTDPTTDPYTDGDSMAMLPENQATIDNVIGTANYDMGHVFGGQNAGGRGAYTSVCQPATKAQGATALLNPVGDFFNVKYVCHEFGHQFGAHHIFNSDAVTNCGPNRTAGTAWEPGSGSTIMSYSGLCPGQDIQNYSDPYYNIGSYEEMRAFIVTTTCAVVAGTGNTPPQVSVPQGGLTLPIGTPFVLTASGADAEGDALVYSWQELDLGSPGGPTVPQAANDNIPLFRALPPTTVPTRYFPQLNDVVNNVATIGERLPTVTRRLTFKCVAKDLHQSALGVIGGVTTSDSVKLRVTSAAGPFVVTSPNTALSWVGGSTYNVTWSVAGTTANGVNCALVNVRLSTDGGYTYPTALALNVPNNGTTAITLPSVTTTQARIMVAAADNYFFDISNANFTISSPSVCPPPTALVVSNITNTGARVAFNPGSAAQQYVVTTVPATTAQTVTTSPITLTSLLPGTAYTVYVASTCSGGSTSVAGSASFTTMAPPLCGAPSDLAVTSRTMTGGTFNFVGSSTATSYTITTIPATTSQTVAAGPVTLTGMTAGTTYTVQVVSNCANGATSAAASLRFRTVPLVPTNDLCSNALPLACGQRVTGSTESATATGDPTTFCGESVDGGGVFYTIAGTGGSITLTNCDLATDYDTKLFVYQGACGGPYTCIAGNDDTNAAGCAQPSTVTFNSVQGVSYLVFVSGYGGDKGNYALLASCATVSATASAAAATFEVWPNPAGTRGAFRITLATPTTAATATLCNVLGQRVAQRAFVGSATELSTVGLAAGTYLLAVQVVGQAPAVRRVVVE